MSPDSTPKPMPKPAPDSEHTPRLNPAAMTPDDAARLLTRAGGVRIQAEQIRDDIDAGAPTNADGTINLVHYAAWLVQQSAAGGTTGGD